MLKHCFSSHCGSQERWKVKKLTQTVYVIKMKDMNNWIEIKHIDDNQISNVFVVFFWIIDNKIDWKQCTSRGHIILYLLTIIILVWFINKNKVSRLSSITVYKQSDKYTCKFCMLLQQPSLVWWGLGFLNFLRNEWWGGNAGAIFVLSVNYIWQAQSVLIFLLIAMLLCAKFLPRSWVPIADCFVFFTAPYSSHSDSFV